MRLLVRRRGRAQGLAEVAAVCSIMTTLAGGGAGAAWQVLGAGRTTEMRAYLHQVYMAVTMYADDHDGRLPVADMYPDLRVDPQAALRSPRSIRRVLSGYAADNKLWVSPTAPDMFQRAGLTYVWNVALNGQTLDGLPERTWLLMDMNAAAYAIPDLVPRAQNGYLVLWSDGQVKLEMVPPRVVSDAQAATLRGLVPAGGAAPGAATPGAPVTAGPGLTPVAIVPSAKKAPREPGAAQRQKEEQARRSNPDEDDAADD